MNSPPKAFRRRLHSHNLHVLLGSLISLLAALLVWATLYHIGRWLLHAGITIGQGIDATLPINYDWFFAGALIAFLTIAILDRWLFPFTRLRERPILGWHLVKEILLLPANLTLGISDNLKAYRKITRTRISCCWQVLQELSKHGSLPESKVSRLGLHVHQSEDALLTLQLCGLVNLHHGKEDWFYRIPSSQEETVRNWIAAKHGV